MLSETASGQPLKPARAGARPTDCLKIHRQKMCKRRSGPSRTPLAAIASRASRFDRIESGMSGFGAVRSRMMKGVQAAVRREQRQNRRHSHG